MASAAPAIVALRAFECRRGIATRGCTGKRTECGNGLRPIGIPPVGSLRPVIGFRGYCVVVDRRDGTDPRSLDRRPRPRSAPRHPTAFRARRRLRCRRVRLYGCRVDGRTTLMSNSATGVRSGSSAPAQFVQPMLGDAEVMSDFVHDGDRYFVHQFLFVAADIEQGVPVYRDAIR